MEGDRARQGQLADISAAGSAVLFVPGQAPTVGEEICLAFQLNDGEPPYHLGGTVRAQVDVGSVKRCGIEFRKSRLPGFLEQEHSITNFVMGQRETSGAEMIRNRVAAPR
jgi:hypothetical protein